MARSFVVPASALFLSLAASAAPPPPENGEGPSGQSQLLHKREERKFSLSAGVEYANLQPSKGETLSAMGVEANGVYSLSREWGLGITLRQGFSAKAFDPLFTSWGAGFVWAATGTLQLVQERTLVDGREVLSSNERDPGGLRFQFGLTQYFVTGSESAVSFAGPALRAWYELPSAHRGLRYYGGLEIDQIANGILTIRPFQIVMGASLWL